MKGSTRLALLLGADLGDGGPAPLETSALGRVLGWAKKAGGAFDPAAAPGDTAHLTALLGRASVLDHALSAWDRAGVWVIGRDEAGFPRRLKRRLGGSCPWLLFGRGDPAMLGRGGIALIAGPGASTLDGLVAAIADAGSSVILADAATAGSGAAIVIGQQGGLDGQAAPGRTLVGLLAPGIPGGDRETADACRYGLADAALLVGLRRGDPAWPGAVAAISSDLLPIWIDGVDGEAALLVRVGARLLPSGPFRPADLTRPQRSQSTRRGRAPASAQTPAAIPKPQPAAGFAEAQARFEPASPRGAHLRLVSGQPRDRAAAAGTVAAGPTLYEVFEIRLAGLLSHAPLGVVRIAETMELTRPQTEAWLLRAEADGRVRPDRETGLFAWISG